MAHARLGPSNARWPKCPGSVREEANYVDVPGAAAIDGTGSHLLLEMCMDNNVRAEVYDSQIIGANHSDNPMGWLVSIDRIDRVNMCLDYIKRRVDELGEAYPKATITVESETKADPGGFFGRNDWWGTVDITITVRDSMVGNCLFIEVIDYKDGRGWVHVKNNTQLLSYVGGKMRPFVGSGPDLVRPFKPHNVGGCRITIVQPKTSPPIRYDDEITPSDVMSKLSELSLAAHATDKPNAPLTAGKHCQWCKHKPNCNAKTEQSLNTVESMSNEIVTTEGENLFEYIGKAVADPANLTAEQLTELADARAGLMAAFDKVEAEIERRIDNGEKIPGYAMMPGNDKQVYSVADGEVEKALKGRKFKKDDIFPSKLITPAQVMKSPKLTKEQKSKFADKYISKIASNKLSLKKVAREEKSAELMFGNVDEPVVQCNTSSQSMFDEPSFF